MTKAEALVARAAALDLTIPDEYCSGVLDNLALIEAYERLVLAVDMPERTEPAFEYHP